MAGKALLLDGSNVDVAALRVGDEVEALIPRRPGASPSLLRRARIVELGDQCFVVDVWRDEDGLPARRRLYPSNITRMWADAAASIEQRRRLHLAALHRQRLNRARARDEFAASYTALVAELTTALSAIECTVSAVPVIATTLGHPTLAGLTFEGRRGTLVTLAVAAARIDPSLLQLLPERDHLWFAPLAAVAVGLAPAEGARTSLRPMACTPHQVRTLIEAATSLG